ncbi:TIM-barrel domain-containing protein [Prevotella sp. KH2C16]|uniref:TIM-barrel domain-containing protein n=1 Tax=Prevotella sp. KH2C16 TaxID=1855325 RepID=UPI0008EBF1E5|nr:TIM-barrel domain-containing protein [Prevotella sp. KH2C16]SFG33704.1 alpha-D-xyloside xylohydrolase [Prevotella sp. KH2C16]
MRTVKLLILLTFLTVPTSISKAQDYEERGNQVTIRVSNPGRNGASLVRLQVVNSRIVRVEATAGDTFPQKQSLIIVPQKPFSDFRVDEEGADINITTADIKVLVNRHSGRILFKDKAGKTYLAEAAEGGKTLTPFTVPDREMGVDIAKVPDAWKHGFSWQARFDSPADEAFYGLGQHQAEEFNMKGLNEDLFQYNTKVSVPFVLSNKNYGILWDSYSYCRWGNPNEYLQLNRAFKLYDRRGKEGHLTGTYIDRTGKTLVRDEDSLYFEFDTPAASRLANAVEPGGIKNLPKGFSLNGSNVVYEGFLEAPENGNYHFMLYYAGYIKVYLDGREAVAERWRTAWNPNSWKFVVPLVKGRRTQIRVEWQPDGDVSYCGLRVARLLPEKEQGMISIWSEMSKDLDYYFIAGRNADEVISGYRTLTGKAQVYPKWALGFWQSRERYKTSEEIEATLAEFRKRHIPIDNIVQDWNYWKLENWGDHTFETSRYPHPQAMLDSVHAMHGRFMISVWPKFYSSVANYKELDRRGWIYHQAIEDDIHDWLGFPGSFYDAYDPEARKVFWRQMDENLYNKYNHGIDAWWMDASEPNIRDCTPMWYRKALSGPTALGTSTEYFNAYSIVNADAIYSGQRSVNPDQRVFLLTRSGFAGEQRYSTATWSGDIATRWEDMRAQMSAGLNYSMSGLPFWGMDQGGFCVENRYVAAQQEFDKTGVENSDLKEWRELQARWNQFGCFIPLYRTHGQWPTREVWNIAPEGHPAYKSIVAYDKLRYRLMPYLYSMAGWVHFNDYTMLRGLVMDFNGDDNIYDIKDQWMFGPSLMACPVGYYNARNRSVYFPRQRGWYDLYTGEFIEGGQSLVVDAPYERIPVFVPEGSIIPFGPEMEWSDEKQPELINLYVYEGRDADFQLYEDEGTNYNYEKGRYATIDIHYSEADKTVAFSKRKGSFNGMLKQRRFNIVAVNRDNPQALNLDSPAGKMVNYGGKAITVKLQ